jgi:hypothetical protein
MVLITCPRTREPVATGLVLDTQAFIWASLREQRIRCPRCGKIHRWTREGAYLAGHPPKPEAGLARRTGTRWPARDIRWDWLVLAAALGIIGAAWYVGVEPGQHWLAGLRP